MSYSTKLEKLIVEITEENNQEFTNLSSLNSFTDSLNSLEMREFVEDFLLFEKEKIKRLFKPQRMISSEEVAFDWIMDLSTATLDKAKRGFEIAYDKATDGLYKKQKNQEVIEKINAIVSRKKIGLSVSYLKDRIKNAKRASQEKLDLWLLLSGLDEFGQDNLYLERNISLQESPELAPVLIAAYQKGNPRRVLDILTELNDLEFKPTAKLLPYFRVSVGSAIYNFLKINQTKRVEAFAEFKDGLTKNWIVEIVDATLLHPKFDLVVKELKNIEPVEDKTEKILSALINDLEIKYTNVKKIIEKIQDENIFRKLSQLFREGGEEIRQKIMNAMTMLNKNSQKIVRDKLRFNNISFLDQSELIDLSNWNNRIEKYNGDSEVIDAIISNRKKYKKLDELMMKK